jgi:hypothetical protein
MRRERKAAADRAREDALDGPKRAATSERDDHDA